MPWNLWHMKNVSSVKNTWTLCSFSPSVAENQDTFLFPSYLDYDFTFFPKFLRRRKDIRQHQPSIALNYTVCVMESTFFLKTFLTFSDCYQLLFRSVPSCYTKIYFHCLIGYYHGFFGPVFSSFLDHLLSGWKICSSNCAFLERLCGKQISWVPACLKICLFYSHI